MQPVFRLISGHPFNFADPENSQFDILDVAHGLSNCCRFNGHVKQFYSVAQHSVIVSQIVPPEFAMHGLLHDAAEAFTGDVVSPLKHLLPDFQAIEKRIERAVLARFGLPAKMPECVRHADLVALATEKRDLLNPCLFEWSDTLPEPLAQRIEPMDPETARTFFITRYRELCWSGGPAMRGQYDQLVEGATA